MTASTARALTPSSPGMYRAVRRAGSGIHTAGSDRDALMAQRPARVARMASEYARPVPGREIACSAPQSSFSNRYATCP